VEVANRVCTTDFSSTSGSRMVRSARLGDRRTERGDDRRRDHGTRRQDVDHLVVVPDGDHQHGQRVEPVLLAANVGLTVTGCSRRAA
jgi:hypothetical protein